MIVSESNYHFGPHLFIFGIRRVRTHRFPIFGVSRTNTTLSLALRHRHAATHFSIIRLAAILESQYASHIKTEQQRLDELYKQKAKTRKKDVLFFSGWFADSNVADADNAFFTAQFF